MYAIIGYLDFESEKKLCDLREGMKSLGIVGHGMRPHVTLATHPEVEIETFKRDMKNYFEHTSALPLFFPSLSIFLNSGTLYAAPTKNKVLTDFHQRYHEQFKNYVDPKSLYAPSNWVPHCTIVMDLSHEDLVKAFDYSARNLQPFHATLDSIALIKLQYEADVCTSVKDILTVNLNKGYDLISDDV
ncbi:2'-5' RNA ligase family protein [Fictibacillus sp. UD]|uniref:2'-5' RNA ligase family protein n=1 Tax=Fictibacillus sp. UD TaxID=3038777 RepID=UPI003744F303